MIQAILFDVGGTLNRNIHSDETDNQYIRALHKKLLENGMVVPDDDSVFLHKTLIQFKRYKRFAEETRRELSSLIFWRDYFLADYGFSDEKLAPICEELSCHFDWAHTLVQPREGLLETISALHEMGFRLGVISNIISQTFVPQFLETHQIAEFFEMVLLSSQCGIRKPNPAIFQIAFDRMNLDAHDCAYVGDTLSRDVLGSRNADIGVVVQIQNALIRKKDAQMDNTAIYPDYRIGELPELIDVMAKLMEDGGKRLW